MRPRLRLFTGETGRSMLAPPQVSVRLGDVTRALRDAIRKDRAWVDDFEDDEVQISTDLYEVISAYMHLRPSA